MHLAAFACIVSRYNLDVAWALASFGGPPWFAPVQPGLFETIAPGITPLYSMICSLYIRGSANILDAIP